MSFIERQLIEVAAQKYSVNDRRIVDFATMGEHARFIRAFREARERSRLFFMCPNASSLNGGQ
jgi:hypothetical protein